MTPAARSPCAACHTRCCFDYTVTVTGYDAWRIATRLNLALEQFLFVLRTTDEQSQQHAFHLDASDDRHVIALAKQGVPEGEAGDGREACVFWLSLPGGYGRCGIHAERPEACRTYPMYMRDGAVHVRQDALCPSGAWSTPSLDMPAWQLALLRGHFHNGLYTKVVEAWNQRLRASSQDASPRVFYAYLMSVYRRLGPLVEGMPPDAERATLTEWNRRAERGGDPLANCRTAGREWKRFAERVRDAVAGAPVLTATEA